MHGTFKALHEKIIMEHLSVNLKVHYHCKNSYKFYSKL